jgi:sugar (pentulose or hexulose) kinase
MSVKMISFGDIIAAAEINDIDEALRHLMKIAFIDDGGIAGIVFSGGEVDSWPHDSKRERIRMLAYWLAVEASYEEQEA